MDEKFRIGISPDFKQSLGNALEPFLAEVFGPLPFVEYEYMPNTGRSATAEQLMPYDGVVSLSMRYEAASLQGVERLAVIARWGVGYDMLDVPACTRASVLLAITVDAVRRPVAEAIVTLILALSGRLFLKDRIVREGRWDLRGTYPGVGLTGRTMGSIGIGNIGGEMFRLLAPFDLGRRLTYDPYVSEARATELRVERVDLPTLFAESDFIAINCPLNDETRGLVDAKLISRMKPTAYLINTARGPIVKQDDLVAALQQHRIAGAGLDVFDPEPLPKDHPLTKLDNVILSPHALAWTERGYRDNTIMACENVLTVLRGEVPRYTVNREVVERPAFQAKLRALRTRWQALQADSIGKGAR